MIFQRKVLHLKEIIHKNPTRENFKQLQHLLQNDIIANIQANLQVGNIMPEDANQLVELTHQLYEHLYHHYYEIGGCEDMKELLPGALELPNDKYRIRIDELEKELEKERLKAESERAKAEEKAKAEKILAKQTAEFQRKIEELEQQIKELQK